MKQGIVAIALLFFCGITSVASAWAEEDCTDLDELPPVSLQKFWEDALAQEPVLAAGEADLRAAQAEVAAEDRTWLPDFGLEAQGDFGQRNSPGEERALGISGRGNIVGMTTWDLVDSQRSWARRQARSSVEEEVEAAAVLDYDFRAQISQLYLMGSFASERLRVLEELGRELETFQELIDRRREAGVEGNYEQAVVDEALARWERMVHEARSSRELAISELSFLAGRCIEPQKIDLLWPEDIQSEEFGDLPAARHLRARAQTLDASSERVATEGAFEAGPMGAVGLYFSPVHDNFVQPEYYVGAFARWRPDIFGIRQSRSEAQSQRAVALEARAQSLERAATRELQQFEQLRRRYEEQEQAFEEERRRIEKVLEVATLRWREGVGPWRDVLDARVRYEEARLDALQFRQEIARSMSDMAITSGRIDELPLWLGQGRQE